MSVTGPGGRRALPSRRPRWPRPTAAASASLAALTLATVAVATAVRVAPAETAPDRAAPDAAPVDRTSLACPATSDPSPGASGVRSTVSVGLADVAQSLPEGSSIGGGGTLRVGAPDQEGTDPGLERGGLVEVAAGPAPAVRALGPAAVGLFAHRVERTAATTAVVGCPAPRGSWWFTGAGAGLDHGSDLVMTNLDPGPAVVDVRVLGPDGVLDTLGTRGIPLAPGETLTLPLADVAPQAEELAVAVEASRGRVAAAVLDRYAARPGVTPGREWLPAAERPARTLLLAGLPAAARSHTLVIANPGKRQALAEVELSGSAGRFRPAGLETLSLPPGVVVTLDLSEVVPVDEPVAVRLTSSAALVATVRSGGPRAGSDVAYAGPVSALTAPAAAPVLGATTVQLTAGAEPARARVVGWTDTGEVTGSQLVRVPPRSTASRRIKGDPAYVVVVPVEGELRGAVTYTGAGGLSRLPLAELPLVVPTPRVLPGPR